jgi:predicted nucleic-acid-binding protein
MNWNTEGKGFLFNTSLLEVIRVLDVLYKVKKRPYVETPSVCLSVCDLVLTLRRIFLKFGVRVQYKKLSSKSEFRESRHSDAHTMVKGVN